MEGFGGDLGDILQRIQVVDPVLLKEILWKVFLFLLSLDILLFVITVVHRAYVDLKEKRYRRAYEKYTDQITMFVFYGEEIDPPRGAVEKEAFGDVCIEVVKKFKGEVKDKVKELAKRYSIVEYYLRQTRSLVIHRRVVSYEKLAYLGVYEIKDKLKEVIEKEDREWVVERLLFAYSLLVEDLGELDFLFSKLGYFKNVSFKFAEFLWFNIIESFFNRDDFGDLLKFVRERFLKRKDKFMIRAFVEALGNKRLFKGIDFVLEVYRELKEDVLTRISCIRAFGLIGYEGFCKIFKENVEHPDWRVRAVICKFAHLCSWDVVGDLLIKRLGDENYYVRINAGKALVFFRSKAKSVLEELLEAEDRFVRDTARYLLQELEVVGHA